MGLIARLLLNERAKFDRICGELQTARSFPEDVEEIRDMIGADSLGFLSLEGLRKIAPQASCGFCDGCFTGNYPVCV